MTKKEILTAADANTMNYCMHRGVARAAFIEGALWAMKYSREVLARAKAELDSETEQDNIYDHEKEM